jgi:RecB family exonuclease
MTVPLLRDSEQLLLTSSSLRTLRSCQRLHQLKYVLGYRPVAVEEPLYFGTLAHKGLEAWWRGDRDLQGALAQVQLEQDPFMRAKAEVMLLGYHERWRKEDFEVLAVEVPFRRTLVNPETGAVSRTFMLAGKIDAIVRNASGRVLAVEHKTSSEDVSPGSDYRKKLRMDGQVSIYFDGATSLGYEPEGCIYDVLGKPMLRPYEPGKKRLVAETPDEYRARLVEALAEDPNRYFARFEVARLENDLVEARADVWQLGIMERESRRTGRAPRNPENCFKFNRTCAFWPVCVGEGSLDDPRYERVQNVHPELSEEERT